MNDYAILHDLWTGYARKEPSHQMQTESRSDMCIEYM